MAAPNCCDFEASIREGSYTIEIAPATGKCIAYEAFVAAMQAAEMAARMASDATVNFARVVKPKPPKRKPAPPMAEPFWKRFERKSHVGNLSGKKSKWHHGGGK